MRSLCQLLRSTGPGCPLMLVVTEGGELVGLVTDRDLVVRVLADGQGPQTDVREACSANLVTVAPGDDVRDAARVMAEHGVRRLPVVSGDKVVGIVSLGDLAIERDPDSVLGQVSSAPPNA